MSKLALFGGEKTRNKPYLTQAIIKEEERRRVNEVLDSGVLSGFIAKAGDNFLGGRQVREFEDLARQYFRCKHAVACNSATAALHMAVAACGIGPGDEVIVTPYTMSASATAIIMQNAIPVFADIDERTFCLSPQEIRKKITPQTKAIMVVHLFGYPAEMDEIMKIARKHKLFVIEDCAQAPGAMYKGRYVGTIGDVGVFSLNQHKTITCGEGGFAITADDKLALRMQLVRNHGEAVVADMKIKDISNIVGYNYRMTELEAAIAIGQFRRLDELNKYRIDLVNYFLAGLQKFPGLVLPQNTEDRRQVYFVVPIRVDTESLGISRDLLVKALVAEGIPFGAGYVKPIYLDPMYQRKIAYGKNGHPFTCRECKGKVNYKHGICPVAERMHEQELMVTGVCRYPHTKQDIDDAILAFRKIFDHLDDLRNFKG